MGSTWQDDAERKARVQNLGENISAKLEEIKNLYREDVKVTLIVRNTNKTNRDTVMTDDDPREAVKALEALFADPTSEVHFTSR